jgi:hypothetical protein
MPNDFPTFYTDLYTNSTQIAAGLASLHTELSSAPYNLQRQLLEITQQSSGAFAKLVNELPRRYQQDTPIGLRAYLLKDMRSPLSTAISAAVLMLDTSDDPSAGTLSPTQQQLLLDVNQAAQRTLDVIENFADTLT